MKFFYLMNTESVSLSGSKGTKHTRQQNKITKTIPYTSTSMECHTPDTLMDVDHPVSRTKLDNSSTEHALVYITVDSTISNAPINIDLHVSATVLGKRAFVHMDPQSDRSQRQRQRLD
jgi:hypothetical protein